ncbi:MAG: hypothetical protein L6V91_05270 [Bacilli bacterium]|nr:MAG: hypothetical protein L6V91_05270 [Bacilli bacterium]
MVEDVVIAYPANAVLSFSVAVIVLLFIAALADILVIVGFFESVFIA